MRIDMLDDTTMMIVKMAAAGMTPTQIKDMAFRHSGEAVTIHRIRDIHKMKLKIFGDCWEEHAEKLKELDAVRKKYGDTYSAKTRRKAVIIEDDIEEAARKAQVIAAKRQRDKIYYANMIERRKNMGLCIRCGQKARKGRTTCEKCAEVQRGERKRRSNNTPQSTVHI